jgi:hypothetical protein
MTESGGPDYATALRVVEALDRQNEQLDADVLASLENARRVALSHLDVPPAPLALAFGDWVPLGAVATTLLAVGLLVAQAQTDVLPNFDSEVHAMAAQELDLLEELEFVAWMLDEDELGAT